MGKAKKSDVTKSSKSESKDSKKSKVKEELLKEKIESDSDIESEDENVEDVDSESEQEMEDQEESEETEAVTLEKKVQTFENIFEEVCKLRKDIQALELSKSELITEHEKSLKEITSEIKKKKSEENKTFNTFTKIHKKEITVAKRERRKRNGENKGGFNKETDVPENLRKFLELDDDVKLARPKVMSLLNAKFVELGLKKGQDVELDKKTAKKFGLKEGHVIGFTEFQRFIADQYPKTKTEVDV
jgi:hypothetical protein